MADDTLEIIAPLFENNPLACPKNVLPYEHEVLLPPQQRAVNSMKVPTVRENQQYLAAHPEVNAIVTLLARAVFAERPKNIPEFMGDYMARDEVEDEIKDYLHDVLHTVVGRGEPEPTVSKHYRFLDEDAKKGVDTEGGTTTQGGGDVTMQQPQEGDKELRNSISKSMEEKDTYKMSVLSGEILANLPPLSALLVDSTTTGLCTLMAPRNDSSSHTDSLGTCSLLEVLENGGIARSASTAGQTPSLIQLNPLFERPPGDDAEVGSTAGDSFNDEMIGRLGKRNMSGVSAISEEGIFRAVGMAETADPEGGSEARRRNSADSKRSNAQGSEKAPARDQVSIQEEEDELATIY